MAKNKKEELTKSNEQIKELIRAGHEGSLDSCFCKFCGSEFDDFQAIDISYYYDGGTDVADVIYECYECKETMRVSFKVIWELTEAVYNNDVIFKQK